MKHVLTFITLLSGILLSGCQINNFAQPHAQKSSQSLYIDQQFNSPASFHLETEEEIFMLDDDMKAMVEKKLSPYKSVREKAKLLLEHIFSQDNIALSYASNANVTARDAYHNKSANCMSLTIMAYALAKEAKLHANFHEVQIPEYWVRNGHYNLLTGHVNLTIEEKPTPTQSIVYGTGVMKIDFDPYVVRESFPKKIIEKNTVLSMFYNNKGGQALVSENYNIAYQYFKAATQADPMFSPAWSNLAVLYKLTDNIQLAEQAYRHAIALNGNNLTALGNLSILLRSKEEFKESNEIESKLHKKRSQNPYYYAVLADEAFYQNNLEQAESYYKKALKLDKSIHEIYFGLAKVYYRMDKKPLAKKMMRKAIKFNDLDSTNNMYVAKFNSLNSEHIH